MAGERGLAHEVRARLKPELRVIEGRRSFLEESFFGRPVRTHVREFGALFGAIFFAIGAYRAWHGRDIFDTLLFVSIGGTFAFLGYRMPGLLHPVWKAWMGFAHYLGLVMTFLIMGVVWCLAFVPMAMLLKLIGKRTIETKFKTESETYWISRSPALDDFKRLERQY